ncbi:hypothetical protein [Chitinophaga sancti]|uniref:Outer membrane protein beta-barrel domain-containing protein n=1 Tax=Chitinophaga sancti TaxID=1004 RepID=A0A1K1MPE3_9BACT|nr:hypothetical protein [Chitinophaga sancti]WQD62865.1 hypothetical protein U0033_00555 [Chitinophaga sancti]WQG91511.1 hypothetical protein SR876_08360 [Chitinophaga sancti]SFW25028.1 hypothetical protein SAMN05661012_00761 [Chitinophaga sancti]
MKIIYAFAVLFLMAVTTLAQSKKLTYGPYVETLINQGKLPAASKVGIGAGVGAKVQLLTGWSFTASAGYVCFKGNATQKDLPGADYQVIPVRLGVEYKLPVPAMYVKIEGGAATTIGHYSGQGTKAIVTPGLGVHLKSLDVEVKYETWVKEDANGAIGVKAALSF